MIKLIATDMDGTFLCSDHSQPTEFEEILQALNNNHIIFAVASGRPYLSLLKAFENKHNDILFIAENGAHVVFEGKELAAHTFGHLTVDNLILITRQIPNAYSVLCTTEGAFVESNDPAFIHELEQYFAKYTIVSDLTQIQKRIIKYTVCDLAGAEQNSYPHFLKFDDKIQISVAGLVWLDMMPKGVNKGAAIKEIQASFHISEKETMAFGDYLNDIEMMQSAYYSYAMENSHPDLFQVARFKTASNDNNGVILKINEMLHNNLIPID